MTTDEQLSAYMDDELAQDERRALDQRLVVDADLRSTSDAMAQLRMALGSLTADPPGDMLADFRSRLSAQSKHASASVNDDGA